MEIIRVESRIFKGREQRETSDEFVAFARGSGRLVGVRHVRIGRQRIELQYDIGGPPPSGQFRMGGRRNAFFWRDPRPILARHRGTGALKLLHSAWFERNRKRPPKGWELLAGDIVVELRGPHHSTLRVGELEFPKFKKKEAA